ncbi:hypothetical protein FOMPIDRAFT_1043500 [Fomitopsis schrenkii]|uniref:Uncharacterized protein n=1 Tax=Fomitopsis schrenkii TaxID=2126942 RepID=S8DWT7_FOMSC|nr:hypothetical protein FOMPIDRAFT_1043500 [Fomitopsis schrenkii]
MPLFKSKAQKAEQAREADAQHNEHNDTNTASQGTGFGANDYAQPNSNSNAPGHNNIANRDEGAGYQPHAYNDLNAVPQGTGVGANDYTQHNANAPGDIGNHNAQRDGGLGYQDNGPQNTAPGAGYAADTRHRDHHGHHGGVVDRAEQHVENAVGARAVHNQVGDKEQEVKAIKAQSAELAEAERLEREAKMHRDRAVSGGAHPDNQRLGAGWQT